MYICCAVRELRKPECSMLCTSKPWTQGTLKIPLSIRRLQPCGRPPLGPSWEWLSRWLTRSIVGVEELSIVVAKVRLGTVSLTHIPGMGMIMPMIMPPARRLKSCEHVMLQGMLAFKTAAGTHTFGFACFLACESRTVRPGPQKVFARGTLRSDTWLVWLLL